MITLNLSFESPRSEANSLKQDCLLLGPFGGFWAIVSGFWVYSSLNLTKPHVVDIWAGSGIGLHYYIAMIVDRPLRLGKTQT